jgi:hypothetical protein
VRFHVLPLTPPLPHAHFEGRPRPHRPQPRRGSRSPPALTSGWGWERHCWYTGWPWPRTGWGSRARGSESGHDHAHKLSNIAVAFPCSIIVAPLTTRR